MSQPDKTKNGSPLPPASPPPQQPSQALAAPAPSQERTIQQTLTLSTMLSQGSIRKRFEDVLGKKAPGFISSILALQTFNKQIKDADPRSVISAAAIAATLDLPINPNLGFAHIVPYRDHGGAPIAQFQMGWKGFVQLAIRTGLYKTINATEIYEGELISYNRLSSEFIIDDTKRTSDKIVGYVAYFKLLSGFEKTLYMTVEQVRKHAQKYSKSYSRPGTPWQINFDAMAIKTVVKLLLSKWGILSIEMQRALTMDQGVITEAAGREIVQYPDNDGESIDVAIVETNGDVPVETEAPAPMRATAQVNADEIFGEKKP